MNNFKKNKENETTLYSTSEWILDGDDDTPSYRVLINELKYENCGWMGKATLQSDEDDDWYNTINEEKFDTKGDASEWAHNKMEELSKEIGGE